MAADAQPDRSAGASTEATSSLRIHISIISHDMDRKPRLARGAGLPGLSYGTLQAYPDMPPTRHDCLPAKRRQCRNSVKLARVARGVKRWPSPERRPLLAGLGFEYFQLAQGAEDRQAAEL